MRFSDPGCSKDGMICFYCRWHRYSPYKICHLFHYFMQRLTALICCYDKSPVLGCTTISGTFCNRDFQGTVTLQTCLVPRPCQISLASQLHSILQLRSLSVSARGPILKAIGAAEQNGAGLRDYCQMGTETVSLNYRLLSFTMHEETVASYVLSGFQYSHSQTFAARLGFW